MTMGWLEWCRVVISWKVAFLSDLRRWKRIFSYTTRKDRAFLLVSIVASLCAGSTLPLMNIIFARLVNAFNTSPDSPSNHESASFMSIINRFVLYILYLFLGRVVLAYLAIFGFRITSLRISAAVRLHYLQALFELPISTLDALPSGQTAAIITITANTLQLGISERLSSLIQAIAVIAVSLIIGCIYSWALTLATASGVVIIALWYTFITPVVMKRYAAVQEIEREASSMVGEALASIRMIAACGAETKMTHKYNNIIENATRASKNLSPMLAIQHSPVFFTIFASFALCFWYAVRLYMSFEFSSVQALVVVLMSVMTMIAHLSAVSVPLTAASNAANAASVLFSIIDAPKPIVDGIEEFELAHSDIEFQNVNFAYPSRHDVKVLNHFSLCIHGGKTTAIVGPSGSGKSTTIALLTRWYELGGTDPVANYMRNGTIVIGGQSIHEIDQRCWRSQIGLVQQEPFLFHDTISKNIEYGLVGTKYENASAEVKQALVEKACADAYADEFIRKLPHGYHTSVGDSGLQLSGGQRQRIAIARAIVRQPKILIFDEATSALDVASERIVQVALQKAAHGRTTIVIAHRLSTIKTADHIAVVANGHVIEEGDHESLLRNVNGPYWKLVNAQQLTAPVFQPTNSWRYSTVRRQSELLEKDSYETLVELDNHEVQRLDHEELEKSRKGPTQEVELLESKVADNGRPQDQITPVLQVLVMLLRETKGHWAYHIIMLVAAAGAGSTSSIQAYLFARLISGFAFWGTELIASTSFLCLMLVAVAGGVGLSYFVLGWLSNDASAKTVSFYRKQYFHDIITKKISYFDHPEHSPGLQTIKLATDPTQLQQLLGINMAMVLISLFNLAGCIAVSICFHWKFGLVVMVSSLPIILAGGWYRVRHEVRFEGRNNKVFADSARFATESIGAIRTVASLTLERAICERYEGMLKIHITESWRESKVSCAVFALSDSMVLLCMAFALWYGGSLLANGSLSPFKFLVVYLAIIQGALAAGQWLSFGPNVAQVSAAATRIQEARPERIDHDEATSQDYAETHRWTLPPLWRGADIELRDVWFQYPTRNVNVLEGCSMKIHHGQFAAIVGSSGAGKTSIISLLERFYEVQEGHIFYNGEDVTSIPRHILRKRMSLVAQEASIFGGTIRENILLGIEGDVPEETLHKVCRDAGMHDFISSLPDAYNTEVGKAGISLSGGQRQRISIARALVRDPSVLLLDEATSSLDSSTEKEVQAVFEQSGRGRTMIVVAHRLATVQNADIIFVMHQGKVVESGNHETLSASRGMYWQMCEAQALGI